MRQAIAKSTVAHLCKAEDLAVKKRKGREGLGVDGTAYQFEQSSEIMVTGKPTNVDIGDWSTLPKHVLYQKWCGPLCSFRTSSLLRQFQKTLKDNLVAHSDGTPKGLYPIDRSEVTRI